MRHAFLLAMALLPFFTGAQVLKTFSSTGYANTSFFDAKRLVFYADKGFAWEFVSHKKHYLTTGIGLGAMRFNSTDSLGKPVYQKRQVLILPVTVRRYVFLKNDFYFFYEIGLSAGMTLLDSKETRNPDVKSRKNNTGFNLAFTGSAGITKMILSNYGFEIALGGQNDVATHYKNEWDEMTSGKRTLNFSLFKKFRE
jgi:hypothetical protein